jgi:hypothetical protein
LATAASCGYSVVRNVSIVFGRGYAQYLYSPRPKPCRAHHNPAAEMLVVIVARRQFMTLSWCQHAFSDGASVAVQIADDLLPVQCGGAFRHAELSSVSSGLCSFRCRLSFQQRALPLNAPPVAGSRTIVSQNAMARNRNRNVRGTCLRDCSDRFWGANALSDLGVTDRRTRLAANKPRSARTNSSRRAARRRGPSDPLARGE